MRRRSHGPSSKSRKVKVVEHLLGQTGDRLGRTDRYRDNTPLFFFAETAGLTNLKLGCSLSRNFPDEGGKIVRFFQVEPYTARRVERLLGGPFLLLCMAEHEQ